MSHFCNSQYLYKYTRKRGQIYVQLFCSLRPPIHTHPPILHRSAIWFDCILLPVSRSAMALAFLRIRVHPLVERPNRLTNCSRRFVAGVSRRQNVFSSFTLINPLFNPVGSSLNRSVCGFSVDYNIFSRFQTFHLTFNDDSIDGFSPEMHP